MEPVLTQFVRQPHSYALDFYLKNEGYDGLRKALAMKPDVVYLLTDGEFTDDAYTYLMGYSNYKVRINTIGFQTNDSTREVLEKIAQKFRGDFTEVE